MAEKRILGRLRLLDLDHYAGFAPDLRWGRRCPFLLSLRNGCVGNNERQVLRRWHGRSLDRRRNDNGRGRQWRCGYNGNRFHLHRRCGWGGRGHHDRRGRSSQWSRCRRHARGLGHPQRDQGKSAEPSIGRKIFRLLKTPHGIRSGLVPVHVGLGRHEPLFDQRALDLLHSFRSRPLLTYPGVIGASPTNRAPSDRPLRRALRRACLGLSGGACFCRSFRRCTPLRRHSGRG
jgi:hypothetical protein